MKQGTLFIGVIEDREERNTFKVLKKMFTTLGYCICFENKFGNLLILNKEYSNIFLIDIESRLLNPILELGIEFDIIIHTFLNNGGYENNKLKEIVSTSKYIIINSDEEKWINLLNDNITTIVISYGFNNKATINLSSFNKQDIVEANICFQREIQTINNTIVEPFELPVKIDTKDKIDIYTILSTLACGLVIGEDLLNINFYTMYNWGKKC